MLLPRVLTAVNRKRRALGERKAREINGEERRVCAAERADVGERGQGREKHSERVSCLT